MAKLNKDLLYEHYLAHDYGDEISTDTLIEEAIASIEQISEYMSMNEVYGHQRPLMVAYLALLAAREEREKNGKANT